jgi:hypothetical protein
MVEFRDYFVCENCRNKDFRVICNFSLRFHKVNFSDDLIYDDLSEERFQCTQCQKTYTKTEVQEGLAELRKRRKAGISQGSLFSDM